MSYSRENLIELLQEVSKGKSISRDHFLQVTKVSKYAIDKYFGTFTELKRQCGITDSRYSNRILQQTAKHSSLDSARSLTSDKRNYAGAYLKPNNSRFQTVLVGSDIHDIECDPFWRQLFITTAGRISPDKIVLNGDLFDLPEFGKYTVDPREWDVIKRIEWVHKFLGDLREAAPDCEIIFIEGNHEYRLLRHLSEVTPAMKSILSDLHGFTIPKLLGLDKFEINYVAPADLATLTKTDEKVELRRNFHVMYDCLLAHHFPDGKSYGLPGFNGHHHMHECSTLYNIQYGSYEWHQLGGGHKREASYCNGEKWSNGFAIIHVDTISKKSQFDYIDTSADHVVIGGEWYHRG